MDENVVLHVLIVSRKSTLTKSAQSQSFELVLELWIPDKINPNLIQSVS